MTTGNDTKTVMTGRDASSELAYLTKVLKAPALRDAVARLADRARSEGWTHEEYLAACLQREVAARDSHGAEGRIRAACFPSRKSLEDFDFDHQRSVKREVISHLGTLDFVVGKENVIFLGRHRQDSPGYRSGYPGLPGWPPRRFRHCCPVGRPPRRGPPGRPSQ
ncbi:ATP-binding protein [Streptomyces monashensis]|uniref:ATP-binding protein n=1 Tax=Streptomyces monashensis TaxID=1678012 RepID=UPI0033ECE2BB